MPKIFLSYVDKVVTGITSVYMAKDDLLREPADIEEDPKISGTLNVHIWSLGRSTMNEYASWNFTSLLVTVSIFLIQWYRKEGDPEVCGHNLASPLLVPRYVSTVESPTKKHGRMARLYFM